MNSNPVSSTLVMSLRNITLSRNLLKEDYDDLIYYSFDIFKFTGLTTPFYYRGLFRGMWNVKRGSR
jgi:hypothetical protein